MTSSTASPGAPDRGVAFRYEGYDLEPAAGRLTCRYSLDGRAFAEVVTFPGHAAADTDRWDDPTVDAAARWVFLLAGVSYYKTAAPPMIELPDDGTPHRRARLPARRVPRRARRVRLPQRPRPLRPAHRGARHRRRRARRRRRLSAPIRTRPSARSSRSAGASTRSSRSSSCAPWPTPPCSSCPARATASPPSSGRPPSPACPSSGPSAPSTTRCCGRPSSGSSTATCR